MERQVRQILMQQSRKTHVLHDHSVCSESVYVVAVVERSRELTVCNKSIYGHIYFYAVGMSVTDGIRQLFVTEIIGEYPGVECHASHVYGIRTVIYSGYKMRLASHR